LKNDTSYCADLPLIENYPPINPVSIINRGKIKQIMKLLTRNLIEPTNDAILCEYLTAVIVLYSRGKSQIFEYDNAGNFLKTTVDSTKIYAHTKPDIWKSIQKLLHVEFYGDHNNYCSD